MPIFVVLCYARHIFNCLVQNEPGVLSRVAGILAGRGFNIDSLVVCETEIKDLSRMCIALSGQEGVVEQARRQLEDLVRVVVFLFALDKCIHFRYTKVPVWAVLDYTDRRLILRELLLVKVSILGPEYLEEQLVGGPSHSPRTERWHDTIKHTRSPTEESEHQSKLDREIALAQSFENSGQPIHRPAIPDQGAATITPSEALRRKHQHLQSIATLSSQFGAKIVDVSENSVIVEMTGKSSRVDAFLSLVKPFGVLESARTGELFFKA